MTDPSTNHAPVTTPNPAKGRRVTVAVALLVGGLATAGVGAIYATRALSGATGPRPVPDEIAGHPVDLDYGRQLYGQTCSSCHGREGQGMPQQGTELVQSAFVANSTDAQLLRFLQIGRPADHPQSQMKRLMPPRGGNPAIEDDELADVVGYLRQMQARPPSGDYGGTNASAGVASGR